MSQEEKYIDHNLLSEELLTPSKKTFNFLKKYDDLYNFWINALLEYSNLNYIKPQQVNFLQDLMNGFEVYKNIVKPKSESDYKAGTLYLKLLTNRKKTVDDVLFLKPLDQYNKEIYLQAKTLFDSRERIFKKLFSEGLIKNDSDEPGIDVYEESIVERTKLRRQELEMIKKNEQSINNDLFKKYFKCRSPSDMYKELNEVENIELNRVKVDFIKEILSKLQKAVDNLPKENTSKTEENEKIITTFKHILEFNDKIQSGLG